MNEDKSPSISIPSGTKRFYVELEFVQNLSNPHYWCYLASKGLFENEKFVAFLKYLTYWKQPLYIQYLTFPHCLAFLDEFLSNEKFRTELKNPIFASYAMQQQIWQWRDLSSS